jgi:uncharacterized protein (DUF2126 family)/transglutaminase-like putative cysteine protease
MSVHVAIEHRTVYRFDRAVAVAPHVIRLRPAAHCRTPVLSYALRVTPEDHFLNWQQDPFGNYLARVVFPERTRELTVTVDLVADMTVINPFDYFLEEDAGQIPFTYRPDLARDLAPYLEVPDPGGPLLGRWMPSVPLRRPGGKRWDTNDFLVMVNQRLAEEIGYNIRMEPGVQTPEETLAKQVGSCRDSAWLLVHILRRFGLAARFVSGYLVQLTADQPALDGPSGPESDFTDLHAWAEVYVPGAGWIGLDPTSGLFAGEGHLPLACSPSPGSAAPITGATDPCEVEFEYANLVTRLHEDPRVTLPYRDEQWAAIDALGHAVDERLQAGDVRLTQGGEPTFVSVDDMESPQWTIAADGPDKRRLAARLTDRLVDRFAPGALVHHGQGKWYPGEPLPRWQQAIVWRPDGEPVWRDERLQAEPARALAASSGGPAEGAPAPDVDRSRALAVAVARNLGLRQPATHVLAAYEDPLYHRWQRAQGASFARPAEVDDEPVAFVLPLHRVPAGTPGPAGWASDRWAFARDELYLMPGDSPAGLRLPLGSIRGMPDPVPLPFPDRSTFEPLGPLPPAPAPPGPADRARTAGESEPPEPDAGPPTVEQMAGEAPASTALCVEERGGVVFVFLPPVRDAEHFLDLIGAVERAAAGVGVPVAVEGYPAPRDPRMSTIVVAPDPGVIEVNVQPSGSWPELVDLAGALHEEAIQTRLATETFDLDGHHSGTGGGNHITLGGATPADSPFLRRPDLLRSFITFWQHHPSLSYLFSGRFIGPTSQAPRVDEGRDEQLYELECAFAELDRQMALAGPGGAAPWIVDRLLRNLLVDVTGNTHRAEFCIDKLFSPDSERGRLGLVELRGFEMPPHPRMALVQSLLVRALVVRFWEEPYGGRFVRWGTGLHDRFLLPHGVEADIADVVDDLRAHGLPFEHAWLAPFLEFRFPRVGTLQAGDTTLSLRAAIDPWHVLGEEVSAFGTSRYVDSSVERLEVRVDDLNPERHAVLCNGVPVPLHPTGTRGRFVAGIRFKAWAPPSALHPTIGAHGPLTFDLVDRWNGRSVAGCRYHVVHPGGLAYERFPVNAAEAETRRASRFESMGHTPGPLTPAQRTAVEDVRPEADYPWTLDLRRHTPV